MRAQLQLWPEAAHQQEEGPSRGENHRALRQRQRPGPLAHDDRLSQSLPPRKLVLRNTSSELDHLLAFDLGVGISIPLLLSSTR